MDVLVKRSLSVKCYRMEALTIEGPEIAVDRVAEFGRFFQHRIEYRGEITGRGIDGAQHLSSRGLLLQCLACLGNQSRILHCNHRLCGKVLEHRDLLVGERTHLPAINHKSTEKGIVLA